MLGRRCAGDGAPGSLGKLGSPAGRPGAGGSDAATGGGVTVAGIGGGGIGRPIEGASGCEGGEVSRPGAALRLGPFFAYCFIASLTR
jgi:hypothetical protein